MKKFLSQLALASLVFIITLCAGLSPLEAATVTAGAGVLSYFLPKFAVPGSTPTLAITGYTPNIGARQQVAESGKVTDVMTGQVKSTYTPEVSIEPEQEFEIIVQNTHESSTVSDVIIIPFAHDSTAATAVTNITLTSSLGSRANTMAFLQRVAMHITEINLQVTAGTAATVYTKKFVRGEIKLDGNVVENNIRFTGYRDSNGGTILDTADIRNKPFVVDGLHRLKMNEMPAATTVAIRFKIAGITAPQLKAIV